MKKQFSQTSLLIIFCIITINLYSQITRGASPGELYISNEWYIDTQYLHFGIFHSTDNGKHLSPQYNNLETPPPGEMQVGRVLGDATPGALYNYGHNELWVSFDYGESWEFRENLGNTNYLSGQDGGMIFRRIGAELSQSNDYGNIFTEVTSPINCPIREPGFFLGEFYGINGNIGEGLFLDHTLDYVNTYTEIPIDSTVAFWAPSGHYPQISRGTEPGELYLVSWWLDYHYKIFHSVDTGYTWTQQYESDSINIYYWGVQYTAGREPGSFYVKRATLDPTFTHAMIYIDYSSDYGKTFTTYFHDLTPNFTSINTSEIQTVNLSNYPNPFTNTTTIQFNLPKNAKNPILSIYDIYGKIIRQYSIANKNIQQWDGKDDFGNIVPGGVYLYQVSHGNNYSSIKKLLFLE